MTAYHVLQIVFVLFGVGMSIVSYQGAAYYQAKPDPAVEAAIATAR